MRYLFFLLFSISITAHGQALRDINYKYLYNPAESFELKIRPARLAQEWTVFYELKLRDTTQDLNQFRIQWELRNSLTEKEGKSLQLDSVLTPSSKGIVSGQLSVSHSESAQVIVARVMNTTLKRAWLFYQILTPNYPVNGYISSDKNIILENHTKDNSAVVVHGEGRTKIVSYYNDNFPASTPPFAESVGKVSKGMDVDSTFSIQHEQPFTLQAPGLYLFQNDTASAEGFVLLVHNDYPRFSKLENLADPMVYVCTKQEYEKIKAAKGEKRAFDRVILSITGNAERAKIFIRNYFRRIELANQYFTSYKEGWKTDRGMIYIIFGAPDEVYRSSDRELWNYRKSDYRAEFEFAKSGTLFDPENYVLIRDKRYQQTWYEVIDLWRNARF